MLDYKRDRYELWESNKECVRANKANTIVVARAAYRPGNNNAIVPITDIEADDPARNKPPRDSTWAREVTSISVVDSSGC